MSGLVRRISQGMATAQDAERVARLLERCELYEAALRRIAAQGDSCSAMVASRVLSDRQHAPS
ncbi:MAG: hypothetical protein KatS3mg124_1867 [Porticoccaceae bacterium]|nr:MAG: hypothetical protein KatS3mg124_1867 [Porticoccaceae bacterium]